MHTSGSDRSACGFKQNRTLPPARHEVQDRKIGLNFAVSFTGLAIRLQRGIIDCHAGHLLDCAFHFLRRSGDPVLHDDVFLQNQEKAPERAAPEINAVQFSFGLESHLSDHWAARCSKLLTALFCREKSYDKKSLAKRRIRRRAGGASQWCRVVK